MPSASHSSDKPATDPGTRRGPYKKGRKTREEILQAALVSFSEQGYRASSIRQIAQRVGLTQQGLMHHFASKEELLAEVLSLRDTVDLERYGREDVVEGLRHVVALNASRPGLVRLFSVLSAESSDPEHPAHQHVAERYRTIVGILEGRLREPEGERLLGGHPPDAVARLLMATMDGLQVQWLLDEDLDMEGPLEVLLELLLARSNSKADGR